MLDRIAIGYGKVRCGVAIARSLVEFLDDTFHPYHAPHQTEVQIDLEDAHHARALNGVMAIALAAVLKNAALASTAPVKLHIYRDEHPLHFDIQDEGVGMSEEVIARATEPFFTTRDTGRGMGLGLFLAYSVAQTLNATFEIESVVGEGTLVRFGLPLKPLAKKNALRIAKESADLSTDDVDL